MQKPFTPPKPLLGTCKRFVDVGGSECGLIYCSFLYSTRCWYRHWPSASNRRVSIACYEYMRRNRSVKTEAWRFSLPYLCTEYGPFMLTSLLMLTSLHMLHNLDTMQALYIVYLYIVCWLCKVLATLVLS